MMMAATDSPERDGRAQRCDDCTKREAVDLFSPNREAPPSFRVTEDDRGLRRVDHKAVGSEPSFEARQGALQVGLVVPPERVIHKCSPGVRGG